MRGLRVFVGLVLSAATALSAAGCLEHNTYFVRPDGGSAEQCTGLANTPYPGRGTHQSCAWDHPFRALPPGGEAALAGGDTLIIASAPYRMGYGAPGDDNCYRDWPYECHMAPVPSGPSPSAPTRILGQGWDAGCPDPPELWGTQRARWLLDLTDADSVEVACLELTDHADCVYAHGHAFGGTRWTCNADSYPFGNWASGGIYAQDSSGVTLRDLDIHGFAHFGVWAGRLRDWLVENVRLAGNGWVGWDGDIAGADSNSGTMTFRDVTVEWNGCAESYPGEQPEGCWAQSAGGYGDGIGTGATGGDWIFTDCRIRHNTSDGLDLLYHELGGRIVIDRLLAEGNAGNQVKLTGSASLVNSVLVGNCAFFQGQPFTYHVDPCRALGNTLELAFTGGDQISIVNSTLYGQGDGLVGGSLRAGRCDGTEKLTGMNNIFLGDSEYLSPGDISFLFYQEGCPGLALEADYSLAYRVKNRGSPWVSPPFPSAHNLYQSPRFVGPMTGPAYGMGLRPGSPGIDRGKSTACPGVDFHGNPRPVDGDGNGSAECDLGAFEYAP